VHLLDIDHERLSYKFQGSYYRHTDVHGDFEKRFSRDARRSEQNEAASRHKIVR